MRDHVKLHLLVHGNYNHANISTNIFYMSLGYKCTKGYKNKKIHICGICSLCLLLQLRKIHSSRDNDGM